MIIMESALYYVTIASVSRIVVNHIERLGVSQIIGYIMTGNGCRVFDLRHMPIRIRG